MKKKNLTLLIAFMALPLVGCANMFPQHGRTSSAGQFDATVAPSTTASSMPQYHTGMSGQQIAPQPAQQFVPQQQSNAVQMMHSQTMSEMATLKERVRRVERAMIRLDRRMQLIERNALSKINPADPDETGTVLQPMSNLEGQTNFYSDGYSQSQAAGFKPVSHNYVTSSLQAAPKASTVAKSMQASSMLPSLADEEEKNMDVPAVSIWTINYEPRKIWPSREQLPGSRDVVEALRNSENVTLFARGMHSASKEFRDRVRAISRYLGRVSGQTNVSIAAMPDDKMGGDTIEIIATK